MTDIIEIKKIVYLSHDELMSMMYPYRNKCPECNKAVTWAYEEDYETNIPFCHECKILFSELISEPPRAEAKPSVGGASKVSGE